MFNNINNFSSYKNNELEIRYRAFCAKLVYGNIQLFYAIQKLENNILSFGVAYKIFTSHRIWKGLVFHSYHIYIFFAILFQHSIHQEILPRFEFKIERRQFYVMFLLHIWLNSKWWHSDNVFSFPKKWPMLKAISWSLF